MIALDRAAARDLVGSVLADVRAAGVDRDHWDEGFMARRAERYQQDVRVMSRELGDDPVIEVGSVPCHLTLALARMGRRVIGVDIDPTRATSVIEATGLDVRRVDVEAEALPFDDASFGSAVFTEILEHLRIDPLFTLSEVNRVLRPGGILYLSTPNLYSLDKLVSYVRGRGFNDPLEQFLFLRRMGHMGHIREYSRREVTALLEWSGFEVTRVERGNHHDYGGGLIGALVRFAHVLLPRTKARLIVIARKVGRPNPLAPLGAGS